MSTTTTKKAVPSPPEPAASGRASSVVAAGILLSRIAGLVRERVLAQFFGTSLYADVFRAGLRMPNVLQNLLGEGTLSASFIPVYSELLHEGKEEEAGRVAGAIFSLLFALAGALALFGVIFAPVMVDVLLPGFEGERRELTIRITRILFPMTGILVMSAWALGILNSHRRFFVPYFAPVLWNGAMIAALFWFGGQLEPGALVVAVAWGALVGGMLQFGIQLPSVIRLERKLRIRWNTRLQPVRDAVRNAVPAIMGRGVVQLSGYVDFVLASLLAIGAVATISFALTIYILPVSLFGMSVAVAELPELARQRTAAAEVLRERTNAAVERISFYVIPSFIAFVLLGDVLVAALYQTGEFDRIDTLIVYLTLVGFSTGLIASTTTRLFSSTFFALRDTTTPAKYATLRVANAALFGFILMTQFEQIELFGWTIPGGVFSGWLVGGRSLGPVGLALGSGIAAWIEWVLLRRALKSRIGSVGARASVVARMFAAALAGAAAGWGVRYAIPEIHPVLRAIPIVGAFGLVYFGVAAAVGLAEARNMVGRIGRLAGRGR